MEGSIDGFTEGLIWVDRKVSRGFIEAFSHKGVCI